MVKSFVNPYNFIPFQYGTGDGEKRKKQSREDAYRNPELEMKSGWIDLTITAKNPLIIPDGAHPEYIHLETKQLVTNPDLTDRELKKKLHKRYDFLRMRNPEGKMAPVIPGSSIQGTIRSTFEAVTDSCVPHLLSNHAISQRIPLYAALNRRGLLGYNKKENRWTLYSTTKILKKGDIITSASGIQFKSKGVTSALPSPGTLVEGKGYLQYNVPIQKRGYNIAYLQQDEIIKEWDEGDQEPYAKMKSVLERDGVKGNSKNPNDLPRKQLLNVLKKVKDTGEGMVPVRYFIVHRKLQENENEERVETLVYLSNSACGRIAQRRSWEEIMGDYAPCKDTNHLCPACLLFGTIQGEGLKGHIRFTDAFAKEDASFEKHTLQILGEPRTSSFEYYLDRPSNAEGKEASYWNFDFFGVNETVDGKPRTYYYDLPNAMPRGRKRYWNHPVSEDAEMSNMNATMEAIHAGTEFHCKVYFDEISEAQLKNILWVLTLGENVEDSNLMHQFGHAKPLGYGSSKILVTGVHTREVAVKENGSFTYQFKEYPVDQKMTASFDTETRPVQYLLAMCDSTKTKGEEVRYPMDKNKKEAYNIFQWFSNNRTNAKRLKVLPYAGDKNITLPGDWPDGKQLEQSNSATNRPTSKSINRDWKNSNFKMGEEAKGKVTGYSGKYIYVDCADKGEVSIYLAKVSLTKKGRWDWNNVRQEIPKGTQLMVKRIDDYNGRPQYSGRVLAK